MKITFLLNMGEGWSIFKSMWRKGGGKVGESRGRAPGQASDYALRAPNPFDSSAMTRCFIKISGPQTSPGPRYFAPAAPPSCRPWGGGEGLESIKLLTWFIQQMHEMKTRNVWPKSPNLKMFIFIFSALDVCCSF